MKNEKFNLKNLKFDFSAAIVVFFVALPLCLGVSLASTSYSNINDLSDFAGAAFPGLISGIIGGIVVGFTSGSRFGVSGPAAGLITIVGTAIVALGGFEEGFPKFLVALILAGIMQLIFGFLRAGFLAYYFPSAVIKGMLAGIGITIFLKELPHFFGYDRDPEGEMSFLQPDGHNTFSELGYMIEAVHWGAFTVALISLIILIVWGNKFIKKNRILSSIPAPLLAILTSVLIAYLFRGNSEMAITQSHLVNVPIAKSGAEFVSLFTFPDFSALSNFNIYLIALTIAVIASLETLLCVEATDKLDPNKGNTPLNQELKAQGIGNIAAGLVGGLPITQVIVRSSANIDSGAKTKSATIIHGVLILICVFSIPGLLNMIPRASLAAVLLLIGYKLANPKQLKTLYKNGLDQLIPFIAVVAGILLTDLLMGIGIGILIAIYYILKKNYKNSFKYITKDNNGKTRVIFRLSEEVSFLNKASIALALDKVPKNASLIIDGSKSKNIDFDVLERIQEFETHTAPTKNITIETVGLPRIDDVIGIKPKFSIKALESKTHTKKSQDEMTKDIALQYLKVGNERFVENLRAHRDLLEQVNETSEGQYPFAVILSCIDSRTSAELIFDLGLGDIFSIRVAGNVVNEDILGSMEYACKVAGSKLIVVLGHSKCGAVTSACQHIELGNITALLGKIQPAVEKVKPTVEDITAEESVQKVADQNVHDAIAQIHENSPILQSMIENGEIGIVGAMYDIESGKVNFLD